MRHHIREASIEAPQEVEDEDAVGDGFAQVRKVVCHGLHVATVVGDGKITLHKIAELDVEEERASLAVAEKLILDYKPGDASNGIEALADDLHEFRRDGVEDPCHQDAIHPEPGCMVGVESIGEDVIIKGISAEGEEHVLMPLGEVGGRRVKEDRDERTDVLHAGCLRVEVGDDVGLHHHGILDEIFLC